MQEDSGPVLTGLRWLTVVILCATIAALPWMLGGVVPMASLVLLCGAIAAGCCGLLFHLFSKSAASDIPMVTAPLLALALVGFWQIAPASELSGTAFEQNFGDLVEVSDRSAGYRHSLSPADTRIRIANTLSLTLIAFAAFRVLRTGSTIAFSALSFGLAGLALSSIALTLIFEQEAFSWNRIWALGWSKNRGANGYASFINPNSAGGWLCLTAASMAGLAHWLLKKKSTDPKLRRGRLRVSWIGRASQQAVEVLAELTVWQILALGAVAFLSAAIAATQSRGALLAFVGAVVLTLAVRSSIKVLPFALAGVMVAGGLSFAFLQSFGLQDDVTAELETLQNYETAVGARPQHWWDAAHAFAGKPFLGSGQGSYRFATLPFETAYRNVWFRNADNQYVETAVEVGLIGLLLFVSIGWMGLRTSSAAAKHSKIRKQQTDPNQPKLSRRILAGISTAVTLAVFSQAIAASVDYGIAMPPASSLLIFLIAGCAGYLNSGPRHEPSRMAGAIRCNKLTGVTLTAMTLVAAAGFIPDIWQATQIDTEVVAGHRILQTPIDPLQLDQIPEVKERLQKALAHRPDDPEGLRLLSRLATADFRWQSLINAAGKSIYKDRQVTQRWTDWSLFRIVGSLHQLQQQSPQQGQAMKDQLVSLMDSQRLPDTLNLIQEQLPHLPGVPVARAAVAAIQDDAELVERQIRLSTAIDPSNAEKQFQLGVLALRVNQKDLAAACWKRSLNLSNRFRPAILEDSILFFEADEAMTMFGPETYSKCTEAAIAARDSKLRSQLWLRADVLWSQIAEQPTEQDCEQRLVHLQRIKRPVELEWLESQLDRYPDNVPLRAELAKEWERRGKFVEALNQWQRIRFHHPENRAAASNIQRLNELE